MNTTPNSERIQIGIFGKRNAGKSSIINAITNQNLAIVSDIKGTTTDPISKSMELLPIGPVTLIDTAGIDDEGTLGKLRTEKTLQILNKTDIALLITDTEKGLSDWDNNLISLFKEKNIKYIIVYNKADLNNYKYKLQPNEIVVSATQNINIKELKELIGDIYEQTSCCAVLIKDIIKPKDNVIMVTPIDSSAPKGRIILPQQQVLRDLLEANAITTVVREFELKEAIENSVKKPKLVITDSQAFGKISEIVPDDILLTSFSILFARYKGVLKPAVKGVKAINNLNNGDTILIAEGCTHHRQCEDIGSVKIPKWLEDFTGKKFNYKFSSGTGFPSDLSEYQLIIHCGSCMLKDREVLYRYNCAINNNIPVTNYGIAIAYMHNILKRSLKVFPDIYSLI